MPPLRPCLGCGKPTRGSRCNRVGCQLPRRVYRKPNHSTRRPDYTHAERTRRAHTVRAWREQHGDWCPGYQVPPHPATDLTADHVNPVAAGGHESGPLTVLCRACNGRKQHRT